MMGMLENEILFIKTKNQEATDRLIKQGFSIVYNRQGDAVFLYDAKLLEKYALQADCWISDTITL